MKVFKVLILILITINVIGQEKYAVIIEPFNPENADEGSYAMNQPGIAKYEFWNDIYLMWEMLYDRGFEDENIFVCYYDGEDFTKYGYNERYTAAYNGGLLHITDYPGDEEDIIDMVFTGLADGSNGFPQTTEDDFLVVYTFGHGSTHGIRIGEMDFLYWQEIADYLDAIACHKKVVIMQQCFSGA